MYFLLHGISIFTWNEGLKFFGNLKWATRMKKLRNTDLKTYQRISKQSCVFLKVTFTSPSKVWPVLFNYIIPVSEWIFLCGGMLVMLNTVITEMSQKFCNILVCIVWYMIFMLVVCMSCDQNNSSHGRCLLQLVVSW